MSKARETADLNNGLDVDSSGNVGIGTAAPGVRLHVNSGTGDTVALFESADATARLIIRDSTAVSGGSYLADVGDTLTLSTAGTERMRIDASGNLLVGTTSSFSGALTSMYKFSGDILAFKTGSSGYVACRFQNSAGSNVGAISVSASSTAYVTSSDYRLKENITPVQGAADIVKAMQPVTYTFKSDGSWHDGFLAHELQELHPRAVTGSKDAMKDEEYEVTPAVLDDDGAVVTEAVMGTRSVPDYQGVDYSKLTPILTAALQEALNKIDALETRLAALEAVII